MYGLAGVVALGAGAWMKFRGRNNPATDGDDEQ